MKSVESSDAGFLAQANVSQPCIILTTGRMFEGFWELCTFLTFFINLKSFKVKVDVSEWYEKSTWPSFQ